MEIKRIVTYNPDEVEEMLSVKLTFDFGQLCKYGEAVPEGYYEDMVEDMLSGNTGISSIASLRFFAKGASWNFRSNRPVYLQVTYLIKEEDPLWK